MYTGSTVFRTILFTFQLAFLTVNLKAQSEPKPATLPVGMEPLKKIESKVYGGPERVTSSFIQVQSLGKGSTTHLKSLVISATTLIGKKTGTTGAEQISEKLIIVKEGDLSIRIDNIHKEVGPGSIAIILPGESYTIENTRDRPAVYYLLEYQSKSPANPARGKEAGASIIVDWNEVEYRKHDKGGRRDFFDRPTAMCESFEMHVTNLNESTSSHDPHKHVEEEIILMVQGNISMYIDGNETEAGTGDFAFMDSNVPHALSNIGPGQAIYFAFQWK